MRERKPANARFIDAYNKIFDLRHLISLSAHAEFILPHTEAARTTIENWKRRRLTKLRSAKIKP